MTRVDALCRAYPALAAQLPGTMPIFNVGYRPLRTWRPVALWLWPDMMFPTHCWSVISIMVEGFGPKSRPTFRPEVTLSQIAAVNPDVTAASVTSKLPREGMPHCDSAVARTRVCAAALRPQSGRSGACFKYQEQTLIEAIRLHGMIAGPRHVCS